MTDNISENRIYSMNSDLSLLTAAPVMKLSFSESDMVSGRSLFSGFLSIPRLMIIYNTDAVDVNYPAEIEMNRQPVYPRDEDKGQNEAEELSVIRFS